MINGIGIRIFKDEHSQKLATAKKIKELIGAMNVYTYFSEKSSYGLLPLLSSK